MFLDHGEMRPLNGVDDGAIPTTDKRMQRHLLWKCEWRFVAVLESLLTAVRGKHLE